MWFRLAALWHCPVREAKLRCDAEEFFKWSIYQNLFGPFGEERADARAAIMPWLYATAHRQKGRPMPKIEQFMPQFRGNKLRRTPQQIEADAFRWLRNRNALLARKRGVRPSQSQ